MDLPPGLGHVFPNNKGKGRADPMSDPQTPRFRCNPGAPGLIRVMWECFRSIEDLASVRSASLADNLTAARAMFMFKFPSMLRFDNAVRRNGRNAVLILNLGNLCAPSHVP